MSRDTHILEHLFTEYLRNRGDNSSKNNSYTDIFKSYILWIVTKAISIVKGCPDLFKTIDDLICRLKGFRFQYNTEHKTTNSNNPDDLALAQEIKQLGILVVDILQYSEIIHPNAVMIIKLLLNEDILVKVIQFVHRFEITHSITQTKASEPIPGLIITRKETHTVRRTITEDITSSVHYSINRIEQLNEINFKTLYNTIDNTVNNNIESSQSLEVPFLSSNNPNIIRSVNNLNDVMSEISVVSTGTQTVELGYMGEHFQATNNTGFIDTAVQTDDVPPGKPSIQSTVHAAHYWFNPLAYIQPHNNVHHGNIPADRVPVTESQEITEIESKTTKNTEIISEEVNASPQEPIPDKKVHYWFNLLRYFKSHKVAHEPTQNESQTNQNAELISEKVNTSPQERLPDEKAHNYWFIPLPYFKSHKVADETAEINLQTNQSTEMTSKEVNASPQEKVSDKKIHYWFNPLPYFESHKVAHESTENESQTNQNSELISEQVNTSPQERIPDEKMHYWFNPLSYLRSKGKSERIPKNVHSDEDLKNFPNYCNENNSYRSWITSHLRSRNVRK